MPTDSRRFEIEPLHRRVSDWQNAQPDIARRVMSVVRHWLRPAIDARNTTDRELVAALAELPGAGGLRALLDEQAFGLEWNEESLFDRYFTEGPGVGESGLCRRYLRRLTDSGPSLWRVVGADPGVSMSVSPWRGGETVTVAEHHHSRSVETDELLVGRVIDMPGGAVFARGMVFFRSTDPGTLTASPDTVRELLSDCASQLLDAAAREARDGRAEPGAGQGAGRGPGRLSGEGSDRDARAGTGDRDGARSGAPPRSSSAPPDAERERLIERVRKLFAMAQEVEASPHEAEIALRRCQSLMAKYGITEADLETSAFGSVGFQSGRTLPMHVKYLAAAVARLHDVLFVTGSKGFAEFRGFEVDANVARLTLDYLLDAVERALAARKRTGEFPAGRSAAYDYRVGFAVEVDKRADALVAEREKAEREARDGVGTALTIRKREIVERECATDLSTSSFRGRGARDAAARAAGHDDGARVSLDRQVGGASARPALPSL